MVHFLFKVNKIMKHRVSPNKTEEKRKFNRAHMSVVAVSNSVMDLSLVIWVFRVAASPGQPSGLLIQMLVSKAPVWEQSCFRNFVSFI